MQTPRKLSFRCSHTSWCDMNPAETFHQHCCGYLVSGLSTRRIIALFLFLCCPYLLSCMRVSFGRMLPMLWINPEAFGRGRNLDCTSSQDSTRCESCLATEHEILSAGRWFIFLLLQLGGNGKIETLRKGNGYRLFSPFFSANKFLNNFQNYEYYSFIFLFCYCNDTITWRSAEKGPLESTWLVWMES